MDEDELHRMYRDSEEQLIVLITERIFEKAYPPGNAFGNLKAVNPYKLVRNLVRDAHRDDS